MEELRRRVQADPASIAFAALAEEYRRAGRFDDAIETCRVGLQRHPSYLSARVTLGRALIETGDYDSARQELEHVLSVAPENLAAIRAMAEMHQRFGGSADPHPDSAASVPLARSEPARAETSAPPASVLDWTLPPPSRSPEPEPEPEPDRPQKPEPAPPPLRAAQAEPAVDPVVERLEQFLSAIQAARRADTMTR